MPINLFSARRKSPTSSLETLLFPVGRGSSPQLRPQKQRTWLQKLEKGRYQPSIPTRMRTAPLGHCDAGHLLEAAAAGAAVEGAELLLLLASLATWPPTGAGEHHWVPRTVASSWKCPHPGRSGPQVVAVGGRATAGQRVVCPLPLQLPLRSSPSGMTTWSLTLMRMGGAAGFGPPSDLLAVVEGSWPLRA